MSISAIIHIQDEEAYLADLEELPNPTHTFLVLRNMRRKDGKPLSYVADGATAFLYSWNRVTFVELIGEIGEVTPVAAASRAAGTAVLGFFREDDN